MVFGPMIAIGIEQQTEEPYVIAYQKFRNGITFTTISPAPPSSISLSTKYGIKIPNST